ncbi:MAG TPA: hypothetical protein PK156_08165, partial [Polyangium sp.]|nr:hypothetical protein [Polyangium sp.]
MSSPHFVHDEGLLMYGFARSLSEAFLPCLFFQKVKPALALFYAPVAWFGLTYYLMLHVLVAAATLYWTHAVARSLHHKRPWLPTFVLFISPLFLWSTTTGVSNSDGVAATALFLYLLETRKNLFAAGFVLGVLPWIRYEQALFSAVLAPWVLYRSRSPKFLAGLVTWPIAYLGCGAIYHHDLLWFLHFLPNVSNLDSGNEAWIAEFAHHDVRTALMALLMVSPAVFVLTLLRRERLRPVERLLAVFTAGFFVLFVVTHLSPRDIGPAFTLGFSSRYALVPLVPVALLFGRVVEQQQYSFVPRLRDTIVAATWLVGGWFVRAVFVLPLLISAMLGAFVAAMRARLLKTAAVVLFVACFILILHDDRDEMSRSLDFGDTSAQVIANWLVYQPVRGEIYTNHQLLRPYMVRTDHLLASRVKFMLAADHHFELVHLSNPANGQRAAVLDAIPRSVFGAVVHPEELDPGRVRPGTWFVLINDVRTKQIMPL